MNGSGIMKARVPCMISLYLGLALIVRCDVGVISSSSTSGNFRPFRGIKSLILDTRTIPQPGKRIRGEWSFDVKTWACTDSLGRGNLYSDRILNEALDRVRTKHL